MKKIILLITFILSFIFSDSSQANPIQNQAVQIAAGDYHSLSIKTDGSVWTWGRNNYGQLGDGSTTNKTKPVQVSGLTDVSMISAGDYHSLVLKADGSVWAWGRNNYGQLGDGSTTNRKSLVKVSGLSHVIMIVAGDNHNLALKADGSVWAWGDNTYGQLGDGSTAYKIIPVQVPDLSNVSMVAIGDNHSLALNEDGFVWAWGYNQYGQLGDGTNSNKNIPVQISDLSQFSMIAAGTCHSLALKADGSVWAFGFNNNGQLGIGTTTNSNVPVKVSALPHIIMITAGFHYSLAIDEDGSVWAWGYNGSGQLGDGITTDQSRPVKIFGLSHVTMTAAGEWHILALKADGSIWAWGNNRYGQLGIGTIPNKINPVQVCGLSHVTMISSGSIHSLALKTDGSVWAWGRNTKGQLGGVTISKKTSPVQINTLSHVNTIASGTNHNLAIKDDGLVWAWGENSYGQLGDGTTTNQNTPLQLSGLSQIIMIAAGTFHSLALKDDSSVWSWGNNFKGQLGDENISTRKSPGLVPDLLNVTMIAAGDYHSLALKDDGSVWAWGMNTSGQLGDGTTTNKKKPAQVSGLSHVTMIAAGDNHSFALKDDGSVWTWGKNSSGQLGDETTTNKNKPVLVSGLSHVTMIAAGDSHSLALKNDGSVWAWGRNDYGQLGVGTTINKNKPVQVSDLSHVTMITAGDNYSLALKDDGTVWGSGFNLSGQLGCGDSSYILKPVYSAIQFSSTTFVTSQNTTLIIPIFNTAQKNTSFSITTIDDTATAGTDYLFTSDNLTFQAHERQKDISINILNNPQSQTEKSFKLSIGASDDFFLNSASQAIITISSHSTVNAPYSQTFTQSLPANGWKYYSSESTGRTQQYLGRLRMDNSQEYIPNLNEAILQIDLSSDANIHLSFFQKSIASDICTSLPETYTDHFYGDGVSISTDGHTWYRIIESEELLTDNLGKNYAIDLSAFETAIQAKYDENFHLSGLVQIKFQQYGQRMYPSGGREWDDIKITCTTTGPVIPEIERQALIDLYHSTAGDNWNNNSGWLGEKGTECSWLGVGCNSEKTNVIRLHLGYPGNNLTGEISKSIENLTQLEYLNLSCNPLTSVPAEIGNLNNLTDLYLYSNTLTNIPPEIGNLHNLNELYLTSNALTSLPAEIGHLNNLNKLILSYNALKSVPEEIGNLNNLNTLYLCGNKLLSLPQEFLNLKSLRGGLYLHNNALEISNTEIINFIESKQPSWQKTQTVSPKQFAITTITDSAISLSWSSIAYTSYQGGYEIYYSQSDNESYTIYEITKDKTIEHMTINNLYPDTVYYFKLRTVTYPHPDGNVYEKNPNTVYSKFSPEISAKTSPLIAIVKQSLTGLINDANITIDIVGADFYKYKLNQNTWSEFIPINTPITLNSLEDGPYTLMVMGKNNAGKLQDAPSIYKWHVDAHIDNFSIDPSEWTDDTSCLWALESQNITITGTREAQSSISVRTRFQNDKIISYPDAQTWKAQLINMPTGNYTLLIQATDIAGNKKSIEKRINIPLPESATIETQADSLLADNTQTLSMIVSFFTKDQAQICVDPNVRIDTTMGEIIEESRLISNNQLTCLLKADKETGTAKISVAFDNKTLATKGIAMIPGPFDQIVLHCPEPIQEVGMASEIMLQLEDAYGHPVSVPYDMDIMIDSTAKSDGEFYIKENDGWQWKNGVFVYVLKANKNAFTFLFRASISGNVTLNAKDFGNAKTDSLAIHVMDQPDIQFRLGNSETVESTQIANVELKLNRTTEQDIWIEYITETDTENIATEGLDYELSPEREVIIPAGELSGFIPLTIINDHIYELKETITIRLVDSSISIGSRNVHTLRIIDDEPPPSPPEITGPISPSHMKSPEWCWTSGGGTQTFRYKIDDPDLSLGAVETKSSCYQHSSELAEGNHVFYVQEYNAPTNQWSAAGKYNLEIDTGRPCSEAHSPPGIDAQQMNFEIFYTYADIYSGEICGNPQNTGSGLKHVELWGMTPEDQAYTLLATDAGDLIDGKFNYTATSDGPYRFFTRAMDQAGNAELRSEQEYDTQTIFSKEFSGYAILAVGAIDEKKGLASHTFSANKIYRHLISRKFGMLYDLKDPLDHIKYFNPHQTTISGVDFFESNQKYLEALENAITEWALDNICRFPGPLYIILIDHGGTDKFYLTGSNDWMDASDLNDWLTTLEDGLHQCTNDPITDIIIIIDTCYAGSFMNDLIKPDSSRIVITSTAENELSFRGPRSPSSDLLVRDGAFFASNLFNELSKGINLSQSFERAVQRTEILSGSKSNKPRHPFLDHAAQHPLMDDNGIYPGHNQLYSSGDGNRAKAITLGYGQFSTDRPEIVQTIIQPDRPLHSNENSFTISVRINNPNDDLNVFIEIRTPDDKTPKTVNEQLQKEMDLMQINLVKVSEGLFENTCDKFHTPGKYTLFFYLQEKNDIVYYLNQSYVYKSKENNNPPAPFQLISPVNLDDPENQRSTETELLQVIFHWEDTYDSERDQFSYSLWISKSRKFETDVIKQEDIFDTQYLAELPDNWDGNDIFWKVQAIDEFGASVETDVFRFKLDDKNNLFESPIVYFQVYDSETRLPVPGAKIWLDGNHPITTTQLGHLIQKVDLSDAIDLTITALTYETAYTKINTEDSPMISLAIPLVSNIQLGDINRDETIDIDDAILGLQMLGGIPVSDNYFEQTVFIGDNVGLADIIYVLRWITGNRVGPTLSQ